MLSCKFYNRPLSIWATWKADVSVKPLAKPDAAIASSSRASSCSGSPRWDARISLQRRAVAGARLALQTYLWLGWAALCAWAALYFVAAPGVGNRWPYYVIALFATGVPISWLHLQNRRSLWSENEQTDLQAGTNLWRVVLLIGCLCFIVAPQLMSLPYGWPLLAPDV